MEIWKGKQMSAGIRLNVLNIECTSKATRKPSKCSLFFACLDKNKRNTNSAEQGGMELG